MITFPDYGNETSTVIIWGGPKSGKTIVKNMLINRKIFEDRPLVVSGDSYLSSIGYESTKPHLEYTPEFSEGYHSHIKEILTSQLHRNIIIEDSFSHDKEKHREYCKILRDRMQKFVFLCCVVDPAYLAWRLRRFPPQSSKIFSKDDIPDVMDQHKSSMSQLTRFIDAVWGHHNTIVGETTLYMNKWNILQSSISGPLKSERLFNIITDWEHFEYDPNKTYGKIDFSCGNNILSQIHYGMSVYDYYPELTSDCIPRTRG